MERCNACPRRCNIVRRRTLDDSVGTVGFCGVPQRPIVARAALHFDEEPCISGTRGSGAIFFSGCNLRCCFCQNHTISRAPHGVEVEASALRSAMEQLIAKGAHNVNLVTASHVQQEVERALRAPLAVPVVWNSSAYESVEAIERLADKVDVYLPDLKYMDPMLSARYSAAPDYVEVACAAIDAMVQQVGPPQFDADGLLTRGVMVRHLMLPSHRVDTARVLAYLSQRFQKGEVLVSLMSQYVPCGDAVAFPEIDRRLTRFEARKGREALDVYGLEEGYVQELSAADTAFIPAFDGTGVKQPGAGKTPGDGEG